MRTRVGVLIAAVALAGLSTIGFGGVASGGAVGLPALLIVPTDVAPGGTFTVSGTDCDTLTPVSVDAAAADPATVSLTVHFSPTPVSFPSIPTAGGQWSQVVTVPEGTAPGSYAVTAICDDHIAPTSVGAAATAPYPNGAVTVSAVAAQAVEAQPRTTG